MTEQNCLPYHQYTAFYQIRLGIQFQNNVHILRGHSTEDVVWFRQGMTGYAVGVGVDWVL